MPKPTKVKDVPVENGIRLLSLIALFTFPLIAFIGNLLINGQAMTNKNLAANTKEIVKTNIEIIKILSLFERHERRIEKMGQDVSEIKSDYRKVSIKVNSHAVEISKLKGIE
jgi:hypothetical protein